MEILIYKRLLPIIAILLTGNGCIKESVTIMSGESADARFLESMEWNKEHGVPEIHTGSDSYSILAIADSHIGSTKNLDRFLAIAGAQNPAAVVVAGDLTGGLHDEYERFQAHFPPFDSLASFVVTGNHDLWYDGWSEFYSRFGSSSYYFIIRTPAASDLFICIDTGGGTLGKSQTDWLKGILESLRPQFRRCFVISHINMFRPRHTTSTNLVEEELCYLMDLFARNKVDMVITGHDHKQNAILFGSTTYIQVPALEDGLSYAGYINLEVKDGNVSYDFINLGN